MSQSEPIADMVTQMQEPTSGQFIKENEAKTSDVTALVEKEAKIAMQELTRGAEADTFVPGSIHRPECIQFWEQELQAGEWVMETLKHGYVIPIEARLSDHYEEDNNVSAKRDTSFVRDTVEKWAATGFVEIVKEKPAFVSPLTVATKKLSDCTEKKGYVGMVHIFSTKHSRGSQWPWLICRKLWKLQSPEIYNTSMIYEVLSST